MNNLNDPIATTIKTYEEFAEDYCQTNFDIDVVKSMANVFMHKLSGKKVLDIGCGPGRDAKYFVEHGLEVTGIDLTANFIQLASQYVPNAKFEQMDMRNLDFLENIFDGLWVSASFLHIPKKDAKNTLLGFRKILKPTGLMFISVKQGNEEKFIEKDQYKGKERFFAFYTQDELKYLIRSCDFKMLNVGIEEKKDTWIQCFCS